MFSGNFLSPYLSECSDVLLCWFTDGVVDPQAVVNYFSSTEKGVRLKVIDGAFHEIHNEVDKYQALLISFG